jgi:hypothetical protein
MEGNHVKVIFGEKRQAKVNFEHPNISNLFFYKMEQLYFSKKMLGNGEKITFGDLK